MDAVAAEVKDRRDEVPLQSTEPSKGAPKPKGLPDELKKRRRKALTDWMYSAGLTVEDLTERLGERMDKNAGYFHGLVNGYIAVGTELACELARFSGRDVEHFLVDVTPGDSIRLASLVVGTDGSPRKTDTELGRAHQQYLTDLDGFSNQDIFLGLERAGHRVSLTQQHDWEMALTLCRTLGARLPDDLCELLNTQCGFKLVRNLPVVEGGDASSVERKKRGARTPRRKTGRRSQKTRPPSAPRQVRDVPSESIVLGELELTARKLHALFDGMVKIVKVGGRGGRERFELQASASVTPGEVVAHLTGKMGEEKLMTLLLKQQSGEDSE